MFQEISGAFQGILVYSRAVPGGHRGASEGLMSVSGDFSEYHEVSCVRAHGVSGAFQGIHRTPGSLGGASEGSQWHFRGLRGVSGVSRGVLEVRQEISGAYQGVGPLFQVVSKGHMEVLRAFQ